MHIYKQPKINNLKSRSSVKFNNCCSENFKFLYFKIRLETNDDATTTAAAETNEPTTEEVSAATVSGENLKFLAGISACLVMVYNM